MASNESTALDLLRQYNQQQQPQQQDSTDALSLLRTYNNTIVQHPKHPMLQEVAAGTIEGVLDPLSIIPYVDHRLQKLRDYRGDSTAGKLGYGLGALAGFMLPYAPANLTVRAGEAAARGLRLVKTVENTADLVNLADKMTELSLAGKAVAGTVSGGTYSFGMHTQDGESRIVNAVQGAALGGVADVALTPVWRAISAIGKTSKTLPTEVKSLAEKTLETGAEDNAPIVVNDRTAALVGRALTLADEVLGNQAPLEAKTEMGLNLARSLRSVEVGELRVIPHIGKNTNQFVDAVESQGLDVVNSLRNVEGIEYNSFLVGPKGSISEKLAEDFANKGYVKGQSVLTRNGVRGTILGDGEKFGTVKVLFSENKTKDVPLNETLQLPVGYTIGTKKYVHEASSLWATFKENFDRQFSSNVLAEEAKKLNLATGEPVNLPQRLSFDGAFEKFATENGITGVEREVLKNDFIKRQAKEVEAMAPEEFQILSALRKANKDAHPEGALVEMAGARGYKVVSIPGKKGVYGLRDVESGQTLPVGSKKEAEIFLKNHQRDLVDGLEDTPLPVSSNLLNPGGVAATVDEAGVNEQLSPQVVRKMAGSVTRTLGLVPREGYLRGVEDVAAKNGFEFPVYSQIFDPVSRATVQWRNAMFDYLKEAQEKVIGHAWNRNIRAEMHDQWVQLVESDPKTWDKLAPKLELNNREVQSAKNVRSLLDRIWEKEGMTDKLGMTASDYVQFYWPRMAEYEQAASKGESFEDFMRREAVERGMKVSEMSVKFFSDMKRTGLLTEYQTDPAVVLNRYIRGITFKNYAQEAYNSAVDNLSLLVDKYGKEASPEFNPDLVPHLLVAKDYLRLVQGQMPEQVSTLRKTFHTLVDKLGMSKHIDPDTVDRIMTAYVGLNHGAFMAFRPAKALINFSQIGHVYMLYGAKYTAQALRTAITKAGGEEAIQSGAVIREMVRLPYEDQIFMRDKTLAGKGLSKLVDAGLEVTSIGGRWFNKADQILRATAYHAQKERAIDAWNAYKGLERNPAFEEAAGLTALGETVTQGYFKELRKSGNEAAAKWLGVHAANDTQWMYQAGAGPIAFSRGAMKLFGQYGSWPVWYVNFVKRGLTMGTKADRIRFALRGAAFNGAIVGAGYATGVNTYRWLGPTSIFFSGGPAFDKVKDLTTIWGGLGNPNGVPEDAKLAMARYGTKIDPNSPVGVTMNRPDRFAQNTIGLVVPGSLAVKDAQQGIQNYNEGGGLYRSLMLALGFDMDGE